MTSLASAEIGECIYNGKNLMFIKMSGCHGIDRNSPAFYPAQYNCSLKRICNHIITLLGNFPWGDA